MPNRYSATRNDPAFIGYFLMNEPTWGFASQTPAEGMLLNTPNAIPAWRWRNS